MLLDQNKTPPISRRTSNYAIYNAITVTVVLNFRIQVKINATFAVLPLNYVVSFKVQNEVPIKAFWRKKIWQIRRL